jgi:hypothetical protein
MTRRGSAGDYMFYFQEITVQPFWDEFVASPDQALHPQHAQWMEVQFALFGDVDSGTDEYKLNLGDDDA